VVLGCYLGLASALPKKALETGSATVMGSVLEEYSGYDISFRFVDEMLRPEGGAQANGSTDSFYAFLAENTHIPRSIHLSPVDISLVSQLTPSLGRRPHIFFFVIDSLRRDYLAPYNAAVKFTPALDALAHDSVVFENAFTHYGGTGLSEPSIWVGGLMLHQQYMAPFGPMNSLQKLVDVNRYHEWISNDNILHQVVPASPNITELDEHIGAMSYDLCSTLQELTGRLSSLPGRDNPIFVYTQAQNIHVSVIDREGRSVPGGASFPPEFDAAYASRVQKIDACLGRFVETLKKTGMYDNSIIVVTSDHGDATGEFGRISHSTSIWPEIMRVPLMVHLPPKIRERVVYDADRISTITDLVPSLYYLLGHRPIRQNPLYGRPLFAETKEELDSYPHRDIFLASDVRAVYGILSADGRYFYATYDSPSQSYLFDLFVDPNAQHDILTPPLKQRYDEEIIEHLHAIGDYYGYRPGVGSLLASAGR
jgi:Sulfatase